MHRTDNCYPLHNVKPFIDMKIRLYTKGDEVCFNLEFKDNRIESIKF